MGQALPGRGTSVGPLSTDCSGAGAGKSAVVRWRRMPGDSWAASVKACWPVRTDCWGAGFASDSAARTARLEVRTRAQKKAAAFITRDKLFKRIMGPLGGI